MAEILWGILILIVALLVIPVKFAIQYIDGKTKLQLYLFTVLPVFFYDSEKAKQKQEDEEALAEKAKNTDDKNLSRAEKKAVKKARKKAVKQVEKQEKKDQEKQEKEKSKKRGKKNKKLKKYLPPIMDIIQTINDVLPYIGKSLGWLFKKIAIKKCHIGCIVTGKGTEETAVKAGRFNAVAYGTYPLIASAFTVSHFQFTALPNFLNDTDSTAVDVTVQLSIWVLVGVIIHFAVYGGKTLMNTPLMAKSDKK